MESSSSSSIKETEYYELLGVDPDATLGQIKRGYYQMARQHHPDKGGDEDTFKKISVAYEILADPEKREIYNKHGKEAFDHGTAFMDPRDLFKQMFGGEKFAELLGDISLFSQDENFDMNSAEAQQKRQRRIIRLTRKLLKRIEPYSDATKADFRASAKEQAEDLKDEEQGAVLLVHIGYVYHQEAKQHLGGITGAFAQVKEKAHFFRETMGAIKSALRLERAQTRLQEQHGAKSQEEQAEMEAGVLNDGMDALFKLGKLETEGTMRKVCETVLGDLDASKEERKRRAEALKVLGEAFYSVGYAEVKKLRDEEKKQQKQQKKNRAAAAAAAAATSGDNDNSNGNDDGNKNNDNSKGKEKEKEKEKENTENDKEKEKENNESDDEKNKRTSDDDDDDDDDDENRRKKDGDDEEEEDEEKQRERERNAGLD